MEIQWPLLFFTLFMGLGAGTFAYVAVAELRDHADSIRIPGAIIALVAMAVGGIASYFHLGHPERIFHILGNLNSGISQELISATLGGAMIAIYLALSIRKAPAQLRKVFATLGLVMAIVMALATGKIYLLPARPAWNTWLLPLIYLASAFVLGLFTIYAVEAAHNHKPGKDLKTLNRAAIVALVIEGALVLIYTGFLAAAPHASALRSPNRLFTGDLALLFWVGVILIGLIAPLALTFMARKADFNPLMTGTAGLLAVLVGGVCIRATFYLLGSSIAQFL